jgi:hypothetical protein
MALAPIALFVFKRPEHTKRTLEALARNAEFTASPLHIFCDGARGPDDVEAVRATRDLVGQWAHPNKTMHEAPSNRGLAASIISGVERICSEYGRIIVVEDDLVVAPFFLDFLNRGLARYADAPQVMQVSGYMFPVEVQTEGRDALFLPLTTSWGWATWSRAWLRFDAGMDTYNELAANPAMRKRFDLNYAQPYFDMLRKQKRGMVDSWAIRWYLSVFMRGGLVLYPRVSLVNNEGFDGSGTHGSKGGLQPNAALSSRSLSVEVGPPGVSKLAMAAVENHLRTARGITKRFLDWCKRRVI